MAAYRLALIINNGNMRGMDIRSGNPSGLRCCIQIPL